MNQYLSRLSGRHQQTNVHTDHHPNKHEEWIPAGWLASPEATEYFLLPESTRIGLRERARTKTLVSVMAKAVDQHQSALCRLPREIRDYIFSLCLEIVELPRVHCNTVFVSNHYELPLHKLHGKSCALGPEAHSRCAPMLDNPTGGPRVRLLELPVTCRLFYGETLPLIYRRVILEISCVQTLEYWNSNCLHARQFTIGALECLRTMKVDAGLPRIMSRDDLPRRISQLNANLDFLARNATGLQELKVLKLNPWTPVSARDMQPGVLRPCLLEITTLRVLASFRVKNLKLDIDFDGFLADFAPEDHAFRVRALNKILGRVVTRSRKVPFDRPEFDKLFTKDAFDKVTMECRTPKESKTLSG